MSNQKRCSSSDLMQEKKNQTYNEQQHSSRRWLKWIAAWVIVGWLFGVVFYASLNTANHGMSVSRYRVVDIANIRDQLRYSELEFDPLIHLNSGKCSNIEKLNLNSLSWLKPKGVWEFGSYTIGVSEDKMKFVVRARVSPEETTVLENDVDGTVFHCDCNDPYFCLTGEFLSNN
jgi:hypothetical protein